MFGQLIDYQLKMRKKNNDKINLKMEGKASHSKKLWMHVKWPIRLFASLSHFKKSSSCSYHNLFIIIPLTIFKLNK